MKERTEQEADQREEGEKESHVMRVLESRMQKAPSDWPLVINSQSACLL